MSATSTPKVIYIAGAGHSGTTLLDLALDTSPDTFSVGELKHLDAFLSTADQKHVDDTGATPKQSRFWSWFYEHQDRYLPHTRTERVLTLKNRLHILLRGKPTTVPQRYVDNEQLYSDIQAQAATVTGTEPATIIDSSKVLSRLIELNERTEIELYVVHVVRDVRGVAYSYYKRGRPTAGRVFEWLASNLGTACYAHKNLPRDRYVRIRYEDFAAAPETTLRRIAQRVGLTVEPKGVAKKLNQNTSYRFGGNGMRSKNIPRIEPDTGWQTHLPWRYRLLCAPCEGIVRLV